MSKSHRRDEFNPPHSDQDSSEWGQTEIRRILRWCFKEPQRTYILLGIIHRLATGKNYQGRPFTVANHEAEEFWNTFCGELWEDVTSKSYILLQRYKKEKGKLISYLTQLAAQRAADSLVTEANRRRLVDFIDYHGDEAAEMKSRQLTSEGELDLVRTIDLEDAVSSLPPRFSTIVREYYWSGKTAPEIAYEMGLTPNAVQVRLFRARILLVSNLHGYTKKGIAK